MSKGGGQKAKKALAYLKLVNAWDFTFDERVGDYTTRIRTEEGERKIALTEIADKFFAGSKGDPMQGAKKVMETHNAGLNL